MNPTMMHMVVRAEQDEKLRKKGRQWGYNTELASYRNGEGKKVVYGLALSGVIGVLVLLIAWLVMAI